MSHYYILVARMAHKMGSSIEFQTKIDKVIDISLEGLADNVSWNDMKNLGCMAEALMLLSSAIPNGDPRLERAAMIAFSAQFSQLDPAVPDSDNDSEDGSENEADDDDDDDDDEDNSESGEDEDDKPPTDEGDLTNACELFCDGSCEPSARFSWWGGRSGYQCLTCWNTLFCEACYQALKADERGERPLTGRRYCGRNHQHLKGPIDGWKGVKDGVMSIDGQEPIAFADFLKEIKNVYLKDAWVKFWSGA